VHSVGTVRAFRVSLKSRLSLAEARDMRSFGYILVLASIALSGGGVSMDSGAQPLEAAARSTADGLGSCPADGRAAPQPTPRPEAAAQKVAATAKERDPRKFRTLNGRGYNYAIAGRPETRSP